MVEAIISAGLAIITGAIALNNRLNGRIDSSNNKIAAVDRRVDNLELSIVRDFVQKRELADALNKIESHMIRIENKLDAIAFPIPCSPRDDK